MTRQTHGLFSCASDEYLDARSRSSLRIGSRHKHVTLSAEMRFDVWSSELMTIGLGSAQSFHTPFLVSSSFGSANCIPLSFKCASRLHEFEVIPRGLWLDLIHAALLLSSCTHTECSISSPTGTWIARECCGLTDTLR